LDHKQKQKSKHIHPAINCIWCIYVTKPYCTETHAAQNGWRAFSLSYLQ